MAEQVVAFKGFKGKLYATEKEADGSFKLEALAMATTVLNGWLTRATGMEARSPVDALATHRRLVEDWLKLHKEVYPDG